MQLTTLARVKTWTTLGSTGSTSTQYDALLRSQIAAVSSKLEAYINRHVAIELRSEDYFVDMMARRFWLRSFPVYSTATSPIVVGADPSVIYSPTRDFSEDAEDPVTYFVGLADGTVEFDFPINYGGFRNPGGFRVAYYGGMAYTLDQLVASTASHVGTVLSVGDAVTGSLSGATGVVAAYTADSSITVQVLSGSFQVGERFALTSDTTRYAVYTAVGTQGLPLCMAYPELVEACNMQVSWWFQRREQQGLTSMSVEGATISMEKSGTLLKGVKETIEHLVRYGASY